MSILEAAPYNENINSHGVLSGLPEKTDYSKREQRKSKIARLSTKRKDAIDNAENEPFSKDEDWAKIEMKLKSKLSFKKVKNGEKEVAKKKLSNPAPQVIISDEGDDKEDLMTSNTPPKTTLKHSSKDNDSTSTGIADEEQVNRRHNKEVEEKIRSGFNKLYKNITITSTKMRHNEDTRGEIVMKYHKEDHKHHSRLRKVDIRYV